MGGGTRMGECTRMGGGEGVCIKIYIYIYTQSRNIIYCYIGFVDCYSMTVKF